MSQRKRPSVIDRNADQVEAAIRRSGSIGELERLAGVEQHHDARYAFWHAYSHLPGAASLDAGVAELKRRIRLQGQP